MLAWFRTVYEKFLSAFLRGAGAGAATAGINYISDFIRQNPGYGGIDAGLLAKMAGRLVWPYGLLRDPRKGCGSFSPFAKILGYDSAKGFQYGLPRTDGLREQKKKFDFGEFVGTTIFGGVVGGVTSAGFYGAGKGIEKLTAGFRAGKANVDSFDLEMRMALEKLDSSGLRPGQIAISKGKVQYIVDNYDPIKAQSSIYIDSTGRYLVEGHHTTVANTILNKGTGMNMNQASPLPPSAKEVYWTKKWYEFWKASIKIKE